MKSRLLNLLGTISAIAALASVAHAQTVTYSIVTGGFSDSQGNPIPDGTAWALVVDVDNTDRGPGSFAGRDFAVGPGGTIGEGVFLNNDATGEASSNYIASVGGTSTGFFGAGTIGQAASIPFNQPDVSPVMEDNPWGVVWFPGLQPGDEIAAGTSYGFHRFTDPDPDAGTANWILPGTHGNYRDNVDAAMGQTADYTVVPEPSTYAAIFGFGVLLFVFLRRRFKK